MNTVTQTVPANPFSFFFGEPGDKGSQQREFQQRGLGSGVLVARDRNTVYVLTNNHVAGVTDGTPAAGSGLRRGDVITAVNGTAVSSAAEFYRALDDGTDREVQFRVLRDGNTVILGFVRPA